MTTSHELPMGTITDAGLQQLRSRIGRKMRMDGNELACRETIRKWVDGIGDINPLYRERAAAESSVWHSLMALPSPR